MLAVLVKVGEDRWFWQNQKLRPKLKGNSVFICYTLNSCTFFLFL